MAATGGAPGVDTETVRLCLELLTKYIEFDQPPDAAFHQPKRHGRQKGGDAADKDRTTLSELGRMCVWFECYTIAMRSGKFCRLTWGAKDKIAKKYNISAKTVKRIWAGRLGHGAAGSDDATKQLRDHFRQCGQGGAGTLQDADDESAEEVDEEEEEEETMARAAGVSDSDFGHWRVYHIVCVFQRVCVCVCHVVCMCECRESERARDRKRASTQSRTCSERDITI